MSSVSEPRCPQERRHTKGEPEGYLQRAEWMDRKSKTHYQIKCPGCGLFKIWVPIGKLRVFPKVG